MTYGLNQISQKLNSNDNAVTVAIYGGLGNQLFQYSIGRAIADRKSCQLQLDLRHFETNTAFGYGLGHFNIQAVIGTSNSLPPSKQDRLQYLRWRYFSRNPRMIREQQLNYDHSVLDTPGCVYLKGYWQSYHYFASIADQIRQELTLIQQPQGENAELLDQIHSGPSIAMHIRRGDYVSNPQANRFHGTCPPRYFERALERILVQISGKPTVYVFSDDHQWARQNIRIGCNCVFVTHNDGQAAHEDLRLMAACQHQVISNSTFSWWAAWSNPNPKKMVIAPAQWFADPSARNEDLVPATWIRLDPADAVASEEQRAA